MRSLFVVGIMLLMAGCAGPEKRVRVAVYDAAPRSPKATIDVIQPNENPPRPFKILALLTAEGHANEEAKCMQGMMIRAKQMGADALAILEPEAPNKNLRYKSGWAGPSPSYRIFRGHAIAYR